MKNYLLAILLFFSYVAAIAQAKYRPTPVISKAQELNDRYTTGMFSVPDANYFDFMDESLATTAYGYINILDWLQGRVAGLGSITTAMSGFPLYGICRLPSLLMKYALIPLS